MPLDGEKLDRALVSAAVLGTRLALLQTRTDAVWNESDHPRAEDGKFGSGAGAGGAKGLDYKSLKRIGPQLGSNPGGRFATPEGKSFYVKQSKSNDHAKNEVTAARLYELAGSPVLRSEPVEMPGGKLGTATEWKDVKNIDRKSPAEVKEAQKDFATHAWLANWDSVGLDYDNQGKIGGKMTTLDVGGSLLYRAQGAPKGDAFGTSAKEWDSLRDPSNRQAHRIFGDMSPEALRESARRVAAVPDEAIRRVVEESGPGSESQKKALADLLIARKGDIEKRAGIDVLRADDAGWKESDHPRDAEGKFSSTGGAAAKGAAAYKATLSGKKGTVAGLIKHMLMTGKFAEKDVFAAAQEAYGLPDDKKWYPKWYYNNDLKKKGMDPPPIPAESAVEEEPEAKDPGDNVLSPAEEAALNNPDLFNPPDDKEAKLQLAKKIGPLGSLFDITSMGESMKGILKHQIKGPKENLALAKVNGHLINFENAWDKANGEGKIKAGDEFKMLAAALVQSTPESTKKVLEKFLPLPPGSPENHHYNEILKQVQDIYSATPLVSPAPEAPKTDPAKEALKEAATKFLGTAEEVKGLKPKIADVLAEKKFFSTSGEVAVQLQALAEHWDKILPDNQAAVGTQLKTIGEALAAPTEYNVKTALVAMKPLTGGGMAKESANKILTALQNVYGAIPKPAAVSAPTYAPKTVVEKAVYEQAKILPHTKKDLAEWHEDATGAMVKSRMRRDTSKIPGDFFAKATSAYGSDKTNGLQDTVDNVMTNYNHYIRQNVLDSSERDLLDSYKGSGYHAINDPLVANKGKMTTSKQKKLQTAIMKSFVPADTPSYRGMNSTLKDLSGFDDAEHSVGRAFEHYNFASCSRSESTARNFGEKVMLKFTVPAGANGLLAHQGEREIVLPANGMFRIDKVEQYPTGYGGTAKHLIHCTYLGQKEAE